MRRYADPVEVRRGPLEHLGGVEGPEQFLWRGALWKVRAVLAYWVETGPWWQSAGARAAVGGDEGSEQAEGARDAQDAVQRSPRVLLGDLLTERELWRVEAGRGRPQPGDGDTGVFDLSFDWGEGRWTLTGCDD